MEIVSNIALISINETLFIQLISFLIFLFIMNRLMFRPLRSVMNERDSYIGRIESEILDAENELEKISKQLNAQASAVRQEAFEMKEALEESGSQEAAQILKASRGEIQDLKDKTHKEVDAQITQAMKYFKEESEKLAISIMEKILDRRIA